MAAPQELPQGEKGTRSRIKFSEETTLVMEIAKKEALRFNHSYIAPEHMLLGLTGNQSIKDSFLDFGINIDKMRSAVETVLRKGKKPASRDIAPNYRAERVIADSNELALQHGRREIEPIDLFRAIFAEAIFGRNTSASSRMLSILGTIAGSWSKPSPKPNSHS